MVFDYVHLGTGNYNDVTARLYTDIGMFTAKAATARMFPLCLTCCLATAITPSGKAGGSATTMREAFNRHIDRDRECEAGCARPDYRQDEFADRRPDRGKAVEASQAGVEIRLIQRYVLLVPGIRGVSETSQSTVLWAPS